MLGASFYLMKWQCKDCKKVFDNTDPGKYCSNCAGDVSIAWDLIEPAKSIRRLPRNKDLQWVSSTMIRWCCYQCDLGHDLDRGGGGIIGLLKKCTGCGTTNKLDLRGL
jgi:rubredoxin